MVFYLARHGETEWNRLGLLQGQFDSSLTDLGKAQAESLADALKQKNIEQIYTSTLRRAKDTAEICSQFLFKPVSATEQLVERHFGDLQGMSFAELKQDPKYDTLWSESIAFKPEGGESAACSAKRFHQFLLNTVRSDAKGNALIVSHGDIIRNFINHYLHIDGQQKAPLLTNGDWLPVTYSADHEQFVLV